MKLALLCILLPFFAFCQNYPLESPLDSVSITTVDSLLQGDWFLAETQIQDSYWYTSNGKYFVSPHKQRKKISFTEDSVYINHANVERFYMRPNEQYQFNIIRDSIFGKHFVRLYTGTKKKRREVNTYEIVNCATDELIIRSIQQHTDGLDEAQYSIVYVYRREHVDKYLTQLKGTWNHCSDTYKSIGINDVDTSIIHFSRTNFDTLCETYDHRLSLNFYREQYMNECSAYTMSGSVAGAYTLSVTIDPERNLLIFGRGQHTVAYEIVRLDNTHLDLKLHNGAKD